ncbi:hypothetical protein JTB14_026590 [Gonioctena quinquepunctata]|nr:hypothetical protein JTB14_026590 [Gonioctena quinquepunctata]
MVYKYKRKSEQQSWDAGAMQRAIEAVTNDGMAYSTAAKTFSVPRNTLKRRVLPRLNQEVREARHTEDPILEAAEEDVEEEGLRFEDPQDQTEAEQEYLQPGPSPDPNQIHPPVHNLGPLPAHK